MSHPKKERTMVAIKPDGIQRSLVGEMISRFERVGLKLVAMKMMMVDKEHIEKHYTLDPEWRRITGEKSIAGYKSKGQVPWTENPFEVTTKLLSTLVQYLTSGPIIAMVWEGAHAVKIVRKLVGGTEPLTSDVGTIRGDYVLDSYAMSDPDNRPIRNLIHASGSVDEAEREIPHWFEPEELMNYRLVQEAVLYDVNLDGILE
ncbi:MAG: nucleoside-diphosphate kinase [bacterium]|nr:nucleoside-diphosphate kinase [bacterium]